MDAAEWVRCRTSNVRHDYTAAAWADLPESTWLAILKQFPEVARWVAHAKRVPLSVLKVLCNHPDRDVRFVVASRRKAVSLLPSLAGDPDEGVRQRVAYNAKCPLAVLRRLADDDQETVRRAAARLLVKRGDRK